MVGLIILTLIVGGIILLIALAAAKYNTHSREDISYDVVGKRRPLGNFERTLCEQHDEDVGNGLLSNMIFIRSKKTLREEIIHKALEFIAKSHPLLRSTLVKEDGVYKYLEVTEEVKISLIKSDRTFWRNVMEEQLLEKYDVTGGPLWRVCFMPNASYISGDNEDIAYEDHPHECACVFSFHPVIADGSSCAQLLGEFLDVVHKIELGVEPEIQPSPLRPAMEHYTKDKTTLTFSDAIVSVMLSLLLRTPVINLVARKVMFKRNAFTAKFKSEIRKDPGVAKRTCVIPIEFSKGETSELLKACKDRGCILQGVAQTASLLSISSSLQYTNPAKKKRMNVWQRLWKIYKQSHPVQKDLNISCTTDVRPFIKDNALPANYMGCYFSLVKAVQSITTPSLYERDKKNITTVCLQEPFWQMATEATALINNTINNGALFARSNVSRFLDENKDLKDIIEKSIDPSGRTNDMVVFSNLGDCAFLDRSSDSEVLLRAHYACRAEHQSGAIFANNIIMFRGKLFWTVAYYQNVTGEKKAVEYARLVREILRMAISQSQPDGEKIKQINSH